MDAAEGMAAVFGQFDLVDELDAVWAPSRHILVYRAPGKRQRDHLTVLPKGTWLEVAPDLWASQDGDQHLLLAPTNPLLASNLKRS